MRISELSRASGVSLPTIKYYLREGLLPVGAATGANQASYDDSHVRRLRLIRAMVDVGGTSISAARQVLAAIDSDGPLSGIFGIAQAAVSGPAPGSSGDGPGAERTRQLTADRAWTVYDSNPGRGMVAAVLDAFDALDHPELAEVVDDYADAAEIVARADLRAVGVHSDVSRMAETVAVGTVLGDSLFAGLRRMAQEHVTHELFPHAVEPAASAQQECAGVAR